MFNSGPTKIAVVKMGQIEVPLRHRAVPVKSHSKARTAMSRDPHRHDFAGIR